MSSRPLRLALFVAGLVLASSFGARALDISLGGNSWVMTSNGMYAANYYNSDLSGIVPLPQTLPAPSGVNNLWSYGTAALHSCYSRNTTAVRFYSPVFDIEVYKLSVNGTKTLLSRYPAGYVDSMIPLSRTIQARYLIYSVTPTGLAYQVYYQNDIN